jgi:hypothetical protein
VLLVFVLRLLKEVPMKGSKRALTTLVGVAAAGALIWFAPHFDRWATGGYFGEMAVFAAAGLVLGVAQLRGREGNAPVMFLIVFLPVLVVTGWVLLAAQPHGDWTRNHILSWSGDIGVGHVVHNLAEHVAVLAFGIGLVFGLTFEPAMVRRRRKVVTGAAMTPKTTPIPAVETPAPDETPVAESPDAPEPEPQDGET